MSREDGPRHLLLLMTLRVVVSTTLLVAAFVVELIYRPHHSLQPLFFLTGGIYLLTVIYGLVYPWLRDSRGFAALQLVGDLAVTSVFVYVSGGDESSFTFLYLLSVVAAAIFLGRRGALLIGSLAWILYASMVVLLMHGWLSGYPPRPDPMSEADRERLYYSLSVHLIGFYCAALAVSYLTERHRLTRTELEHHRTELSVLQMLHGNILRSIPGGIMATDLEGSVRFANPPGLEILGRPGADLRNQPIVSLLGEDAGFLPRLRAQLEERRRIRFERDYNDAHGRKRALGFSVSLLLDTDRRPQGLLFVFQDLTERRALEEEVKLKDRMAVLGEMAAGLAHELRNPLASMTGSVQVLRHDLRPEGEQAELMDIILRESQRLEQTIRDFLLFARPGRFQAHRTDLAVLVQETLTLLRNSPQFGAGHSITCDFEPGAGECTADASRIRQVFWNLATNALKAMPGGGCLSVSVRRAPDGRRRVLFRDQGVGMPAEELERYFRPFQGAFRGGTGLGLAIVYRIVEEHGGSMRVRSEPGCGTEIEIDLPSQPVAAGTEALAVGVLGS